MPEQTATAATPDLGDLRRLLADTFLDVDVNGVKTLWRRRDGHNSLPLVNEIAAGPVWPLIAAASHLLDAAEAADRLEAGVRRFLAYNGTELDLEDENDLRAPLDPAQPTSPTGDADEGRRG